MALVKCPECGKENVSDTAEACPDCGYAVKIHYQRLREEEAKQARLKMETEKKLAEAQQKKRQKHNVKKKRLRHLKLE